MSRRRPRRPRRLRPRCRTTPPRGDVANSECGVGDDQRNRESGSAGRRASRSRDRPRSRWWRGRPTAARPRRTRRSRPLRRRRPRRYGDAAEQHHGVVKPGNRRMRRRRRSTGPQLAQRVDERRGLGTDHVHAGGAGGRRPHGHGERNGHAQRQHRPRRYGHAAEQHHRVVTWQTANAASATITGPQSG